MRGGIIQVGDRVRWRPPHGPAKKGVVRRVPGGRRPLRYGKSDPDRGGFLSGRTVEVLTLIQNIPCPLYVQPEALSKRWLQ